MTITKEYLGDLEEKHAKVVKLLEDDSKTEPHEPYKSKYAAKDILLGMRNDVEDLLKHQSSSSPGYTKLTAMQGAIHFYLGFIYAETEESLESEEYLEKCLNIIENCKENPDVVTVAISTYNQLSILWADKGTEKAKQYLETAENLYKKNKYSTDPPLSLHGLFQKNWEELDKENAWQSFEKIHTLTLYYLAQIYGKLKDTLKSSVYCHTTLKRQLVYDEYDPIDWALNAATLSQFFMEKKGFKQARHHLCASLCILDKYKKQLDDITNRDEAYDAKVETFKHRSADVAICWIKYGSLLLYKSKERLLNHADQEGHCSLHFDLSKLELDSDSTVSIEDLKDLYFPSLDLTAYESQITDSFVLTLEEARLVFLNVQGWINDATSYYTLTNFASDHIDIILDQSQLYLHLLFFDDSPENQAKLHKRRIDLLENLLSQVNPKYYLQYCRQMWFEIAQTYLEILDIKLDKQKESKERPTAHALTKVNLLVEKSILHYKNFQQSFKENEKISIPEEYYKPYAKSLFYLGVSYQKYICFDKNIKLQNTEASLEAYKSVLDFCEKYPKVKEMIPMEIDICKEMASLLPINIERLRLDANA